MFLPHNKGQQRSSYLEHLSHRLPKRKLAFDQVTEHEHKIEVSLIMQSFAEASYGQKLHEVLVQSLPAAVGVCP